MDTITIKPTIRKFAIEFDNGGGITLETRGYSHSYHGAEAQCAEDVKVILSGGNPIKDGWDGNQIQDGVRCDYSQSSTVYNLSELIEVIKSGEIPDRHGAAEYEFWKALGLTESDDVVTQATTAHVDADQYKVSPKELCVIAIRIQRLNLANVEVDHIVDALDIEGNSIANRSHAILGGMVFALRFDMLDQFIAKIDWKKFFDCHITYCLDRFETLLDDLCNSVIDWCLESFPHMTRSDLNEAFNGIYGENE